MIKKIIVGSELEINLPSSILSNFFSETRDRLGFFSGEINYDLLVERNKHLDELANVLTDLNIKTIRTPKITNIKKIQKGLYETSLANVRDLCVFINKIPVITPSDFKHSSNQKLLEEILKNEGYEPIVFKSTENKGIDGANFLQINEKEYIVNISNINEENALQEIENYFNDVIFHRVNICNNHIDGHLVLLDNKTFLTRVKDLYNKLPKKFNNYKVLFLDDLSSERQSNDKLNDINILKINDVFIVNSEAKNTIKILEDNNFKTVGVKLQNSSLFKGGIHCSTLELI